MDTKEEVLKKINKLREDYEYWFEVFRREKDPKKKEEAKQKYKPAISEIIRLQEEYGLRSVPAHSSGERARMDINHEKKKLELSKEQVDKMELKARFEKEKERFEKKIQGKIESQGDKYIKNIKEEMKAHNLDTSRIDGILRELEPKSIFSKFSKVHRELRKTTLMAVMPLYFIRFCSGEIFIENFHERFSRAVQLLKNGDFDKADEIFQEALDVYDKAGSMSKLSSGDAYFDMERQKEILNWEAMKKKSMREKLHADRQVQLKEIITDLVKSIPGTRQTELYKIIDGYARNEISEAAYYMNKEGKLRREKKGNTYKLFMD
jgi:tetratricopeptide (TPR) repeat protein